MGPFTPQIFLQAQFPVCVCGLLLTWSHGLVEGPDELQGGRAARSVAGGQPHRLAEIDQLLQAAVSTRESSFTDSPCTWAVFASIFCLDWGILALEFDFAYMERGVADLKTVGTYLEVKLSRPEILHSSHCPAEEALQHLEVLVAPRHGGALQDRSR